MLFMGNFWQKVYKERRVIYVSPPKRNKFVLLYLEKVGENTREKTQKRHKQKCGTARFQSLNNSKNKTFRSFYNLHTPSLVRMPTLKNLYVK
jgi:hypothetical protein